MEKFNQLFESLNEYTFNKFEDGLDDIGRVHDWRKYIPDELLDCWDDLTEREKKIIFVLLEPIAGNEEWD